jgi:DNA (cytosine-5)-methyltransferase 1
MNELALFAGAGGGILGGKLLGWRTVCAVELDAYCRRVLLARQRDGFLPRFPIWDNVTTFDGKAWRGSVDVISGGFPCNDISAAGKGAGINGTRSGLWREMARIVGEVRPRFVFVENTPMLVKRGLAVVLGDLAQMGYDARWGIVGAHHVTAPHVRDRIWILAYTERIGSQGSGKVRAIAGQAGLCGGERGDKEQGLLADPAGIRQQGHGATRQQVLAQSRYSPELIGGVCKATQKQWEAEPRLGRVVDRMADRVHRVKSIGNGQCPAVVRLAWHLLGGAA